MTYGGKESFPVVSFVGHSSEEFLPCARLLPGMPWAFKAAEERPRKREESQRRKLLEYCHSNREVGNLQI